MTDHAWLIRLGAYGLPGTASPGKPDGPVADALEAVRAHRLMGVLRAAVAEGPVPLATHEAATVFDAHRGAMRDVLFVEDMLLGGLTVLEDAGIACRVLGGPALAHLVHADPSECTFGEIDLFVPPDQIDEAIDALTRWGRGAVLELHRTLAPAPYGSLIPPDDVLRDPIDFRVAGRRLPTLPLSMHLVHCALQVAGGGDEPQLGALRELVLLGWGADVDVDQVVATVTRWDCVAPVARGLQMAARLGHTPSAIERWAAGVEISPQEHRRLADYVLARPSRRPRRWLGRGR